MIIITFLSPRMESFQYYWIGNILCLFCFMFMDGFNIAEYVIFVVYFVACLWSPSASEHFMIFPLTHIIFYILTTHGWSIILKHHISLFINLVSLYGIMVRTCEQVNKKTFNKKPNQPLSHFHLHYFFNVIDFVFFSNDLHSDHSWGL